jgi:hypothetical protein
MALDPIIARGTDAPNALRAMTFGEEARSRRDYNALAQQRMGLEQQKYGDEQAAAQQEQRRTDAVAKLKFLYEPVKRGDPRAIQAAAQTISDISPEAFKELMADPANLAPANFGPALGRLLGIEEPGELAVKNLPGYGAVVTQGGQWKDGRPTPQPQQYGPESFSTELDDQGNILLVGNRGTIRETGRKGQVKGGSGLVVNPDGTVSVNPDKASEGERVSAGYLDRMLNASSVIESPEFAEYRPTTEAFSGFAALLDDDTGIIGTNIANRFLNDTDRQYMGQALDFILAKMRKESGATIKGGEFRKEYINYFPMPNDSPKVLEQKARKRELALNQLRISGGRAVAPASRNAANAPAGVNPKPVPPSAVTPFASEAEAEKAAKAGIIKPGDRISINGVPGTWQ